MKYIDLSHKIDDGIPVYPGDRRVSLTQTRRLEDDRYNAFEICMGMHSGTHMDCPMHLLDCRETVSDYPLERFSGRGRIINASGKTLIGCEKEYDAVKRGDIVLIYTGMDRMYGTESYYESHPVIGEDLAGFLLSREIKMLGIDMPSPDRPPFTVHKMLLGGGIFIIENMTRLEMLLDIDEFVVFAAPLNICAEASPVRAFAVCGGPAAFKSG